MPLPGEYDPVSDDELVYRRVPVSRGWVTERGISMNGFKARPGDDTGISVHRAQTVHVAALEIHPCDDELPSLAGLHGWRPTRRVTLTAVDVVKSPRRD